MIRAVLFDCFGVLLSDSISLVLDKHHANTKQRSAVWDVVRAANWGLMSSEQARDQYAEILGITPEQWGEDIANSEGRNTQLFDYIDDLKQSYKTAILSNVSEHGLSRRFTQDELNRYFDAVIESGKIGIGKPDWRIYQYALEQLGIEASEAVFVDDNEIHCNGALNVGMQSILYRDFDSFKQQLEKLLTV